MAVEMEVTPEEAIEALQYILENERFAFFNAPRNLVYLQRTLEKGWNARIASLAPRNVYYNKYKGSGEPGVVSGATKNALTLGEGSLFKITPMGLSIVGQPLTQAQLAARAMLGGGLAGYPAGSRGGPSNSTGRVDTIDNRITSKYRFPADFTAAELAPDIDWPTAAADFKDWCKKLPIPPAQLRAIRKGRNWFTVRGGKAKRLYRGK